MTVTGRVLSDLVSAYLLVLVVRAILETVMSVSRTFRPTGAAAVVFEVVFTLTDPPLRALRRILPPLRVGNVAFDVAFLVLFIALVVVRATLFSRI